MPLRFERLEIWHREREFSAKIHDVTVKFPRQEMYGLTDQINRASDAVSLLPFHPDLMNKSYVNHPIRCLTCIRRGVTILSYGL